MPEHDSLSGSELPTVEDLEQALSNDPTNRATEIALAEALFERFLYETGEEADLLRAESIIRQAPAEKLRYERAYLALLDGNYDTAAEELRLYGIAFSTSNSDPLTSDELWDWVEPLLDVIPDNDMFEHLASGLSVGCPESSAVLTLRGLATKDAMHSVELFNQALNKDPNYWLASYSLGDTLFELKEWAAARDAYHAALQSPSAAELPEIHFSVGRCAGKLRAWAGEAEAYRQCLALDPDFQFAKNNLGWSLLKAGKFEEAVSVLQEAVQEGRDGKLPLRNLARALVRLGRFDQAIEVLQRDTYRGNVTSASRQQIEKIEAMKRAGSSGASEDVQFDMDDGGGKSRRALCGRCSVADHFSPKGSYYLLLPAVQRSRKGRVQVDSNKQY